jgi:hypothetical protein
MTTEKEIFKKYKKRLEEQGMILWDTPAQQMINNRMQEAIHEAYEDGRDYEYKHIDFTKAVLEARVECIKALEEHENHCQNCADDNISMAIAIINKMKWEHEQ